MVRLMLLWAPILISAVFVFIASSILHMMVPLHRNDFRKLSKEDEVMDALRKLDVGPGDYMFPRPAGPAAMKDPAFLEKMKQGPVAVMTVMPSGPPSMRANLVQWFLYCLLVSVFAAYITGRAVGPGTPYLHVFRFAGCTAFTGYALALLQDSIWYRRAWGTTLKYAFDGLIYGLLTGGTFGWLWPR